MTVQNQQNEHIVENLRQFSGNLNGLMSEKRETLSETMDHYQFSALANSTKDEGLWGAP
jgi:hypothetical protein